LASILFGHLLATVLWIGDELAVPGVHHKERFVSLMLMTTFAIKPNVPDFRRRRKFPKEARPRGTPLHELFLRILNFELEIEGIRACLLSLISENLSLAAPLQIGDARQCGSMAGLVRRC
jgi:hypothetical protein